MAETDAIARGKPRPEIRKGPTYDSQVRRPIGVEDEPRFLAQRQYHFHPRHLLEPGPCAPASGRESLSGESPRGKPLPTPCVLQMFEQLPGV